MKLRGVRAIKFFINQISKIQNLPYYSRNHLSLSTPPPVYKDFSLENLSYFTHAKSLARNACPLLNYPLRPETLKSCKNSFWLFRMKRKRN